MTLVFIDESGFSRVSALRRSWGPRGQTPRLRTQTNHKQRLNLLGAVCLTPKGQRVHLHVKTFRHSLTGEQVLTFLQTLLAAVRGPLILVWDNAAIHGRHLVRDFLAAHPRVRVERLPSYAPELNPVELVWAQLTQYLAGRAPLDLEELMRLVQAGVHRTRCSQSRLFACLRATPLSWRGTGVK
jgi:transposase